MKTMHVKMVLESYAVYVNGKEELRTDSERAASAYHLVLITYFYNRNQEKIKTATERAIVDCEVIPFRYPNNSCHGEKAGKTHYRVYVNDEFVKELPFKPKPMAVIRAIAHGLDWKNIND